jgi:hypothetical protein
MIFVAIPGLKDNATSASDKRKQSLYFPEMMNESGEVLLRTELQVPNGEFRCEDISYDDLVRAGLEPDPTTGALTLRVRIVTPKGRTSTSGNDETMLVQNDHTEDVGAIMNINSLTGKIELRQIFPPPTSTFVFETTVR